MNRNSRSRRGQPHGHSGGFQQNHRIMDDRIPDDAHLAENFQLRDLDLELALLKRKRQLIEEQQMLSNDRFNRQSAFDLPQSVQYNSREFDAPSHGYADYYDDPPERQRSFDRSRAYKRPPIQVWESNSAPKRAYEPPRSRSGAFSRLEPLLEPKSYSNNQKPWATKGRSNFNPTKVTKPKPLIAPNRLNTHPVAQRKALVEQTKELVKPKKSSTAEEDNILHADKEASRSLLGRLELALGIVLKDVKLALDKPYESLTHETQRSIKQEIRRRIRELMLGKSVGTGLVVYETYRSKYPKSTDKQLLHCNPTDVTPIEPRKPAEIKANGTENSRSFELYYKKNRDRLLRENLDKLFAQLSEIRDKENATLEKQINEDVKQVVKLMNEKGEANVPVSETTTADDFTADVVTADDSTAEVATAENSTADSEDANNSTIDSANADNSTADAGNKSEDDKIDPQNKEKDEEKQDTIAGEETLNEGATGKHAETKPDLEGYEKKKRFIFERLIHNFMKRKLPIILPRYKDLIMSVLNKDQGYINKRAALKLLANNEIDQSEDGTPKPGPSDTDATGEKNTNAARKLPYFVRVLGAPVLPKRKLMQTFLDKFNPATIKKHRFAHNLLYVGFKTKEDFDNILAADKTVIGKSTINIKVSENVVKTEDAEPKPDTTEPISLGDNDVEMADTSHGSIDTKLDSDIDLQINDLLSAIRDEEENKADTEGEKPVEDGNQKDNADGNLSTDTLVLESENGEEIAPGNAAEGTETNGDEEKEVAKEVTEVPGEDKGKVEALKAEEGVGTPTRGSARLAGRVQTRRASRLAQNN